MEDPKQNRRSDDYCNNQHLTFFILCLKSNSYLPCPQPDKRRKQNISITRSSKKGLYCTVNYDNETRCNISRNHEYQKSNSNIKVNMHAFAVTQNLCRSCCWCSKYLQKKACCKALTDSTHNTPPKFACLRLLKDLHIFKHHFFC